jgi:hypothetical protein
MPIISSFSGNFSSIGRSVKPFNAASGGAVTEYTSDGITYQVHSFTSSGTLTVLSGGDPFDYLIVGGGGSGATAGSTGGGGGGAGQVRTGSVILTPQAYSITIGGSNQSTVALGFTSVAGNAGSGGNGGTSGNGFAGGVAVSSDSSGGSGGGAGGAGVNGSPNGTTTAGGAGVSNSLRTGSAVTYAVGGTGGNYQGGGGGSGVAPTTIGGGGGGGRFSGGGGTAGAAGIVVVRYRIR